MQAGPVRFAFKSGDVLDRAAVRARRTVRPAQRLDVLPGGFFVVKDGAGEIDGRGANSLAALVRLGTC
jgi:hypothetical protein